MLDHLKQLYANYPGIVLHGSTAEAAARVSPDLKERLRNYQAHQMGVLANAQTFRIEPAAMSMMFVPVKELRSEALDDVMAAVRFPFRSMLLECVTEDGNRRAALVAQTSSVIEAQVFAAAHEGILPSLIRGSISPGGDFRTERLPTLDLVETLHGPVPRPDDEAMYLQWFIALAVGLSILLAHKGMLEVEERPAFSRAERRRSEREGRPLPDTRISIIRLGDAGRAQLGAMKANADGTESSRAPVRAHWVRGHFMRNASGGLSWRMPHLRGAGPVVGQVRNVVP